MKIEMVSFIKGVMTLIGFLSCFFSLGMIVFFLISGFAEWFTRNIFRRSE